MHLRTLALDCLYLNWALPHTAAPPLPEPLRYELHRSEGEDYVFASALLFRLSGLHLRSLPFLRLSYPQMNFRLYVLDGDGIPSVLFRRMLVPLWVAPAVRLLGRQPAGSARFDYPSSPLDPEVGRWRWTIRRLHGFGIEGLEIDARLGSPAKGRGPDLGDWQRTVDYFRQRQRGYALWDHRLREIRTSQPPVEVWPLQVEVADASLVAEALEGGDGDLLRTPHSAWLCPEIPFLFELGRPQDLPLARGVAAVGGC
jgi:hypothetical protein